MNRRIVGQMLPECLECSLCKVGAPCPCSTCRHHVAGRKDSFYGDLCLCTNGVRPEVVEFDKGVGIDLLADCVCARYSDYEPCEWESPDQLKMFHGGVSDGEEN